MSPKQVIQEVLADYRYNLQMGMSPSQSLDVLKAMLVDLIEHEKEKAFTEGVDSGRYSVLYDLKLLGVDKVLNNYAREEARHVEVDIHDSTTIPRD